MPATAQRPKVMATASSLTLVEDVTEDGVRGVLEFSASLVMKGMLKWRNGWVVSEELFRETSLRAYM